MSTSLNKKVIADKISAIKNAGYTPDEHQDTRLNKKNLFTVDGGHELLVVDGNEQWKALKEEIRSSIWAFNSDFLINFIPGSQEMTASEKDALKNSIDAIQSKLCEGSNEVFYAMVKPHFISLVDRAEEIDGVGHFLSRYDGEEEIARGDAGIVYYIYKQD